ncbi:MAG: hypothetical protein KAT65_17005 [Methanophagales archaeon]|nr:hypothetical protein [Methanophagales archaeon]
MDKEKKDLEENDCPLSPKDGIFFLSSESHKLTEIALLLLAIFIAIYAATSIENLNPPILLFLVIMMYSVLILLTYFLIKAIALSIRMNKIIKEIVYEKLTDRKEIRKRWEREKKII